MAKTEWLSHLKNSIPDGARGYTVSMYAIALEGWRRGLTLKFVNKNRRKSEVIYTLSSAEKEHRFTVSFGDLNTNEARRFCKDKHKTKERLLEKGVSTPQGELFMGEATDNEIAVYAENLGYPVVLKPSDGTGGKGVIANIKNQQEFMDALGFVRDDLGQSNVIVEKYFAGTDHRVYVVGNKVIGAYTRIPANVIGDGKNNIKKLLQLNMEERNNNPALFRRTIKVDKEMKNMLKEKGYTMESIPGKDERVYLKSKSNVSAGGESLDVTDTLSDAVKNIAINAVAGITGLQHAGVDLMINAEGNDGVVLEINTQASINSHLFPMEGKSRDIPKELIDLYFPETKSKYVENAFDYNFDYLTVFKMFHQGLLKECAIPDVPTGKHIKTRFVVEGIKNVGGFSKEIQRLAQEKKINGFVKQLKSKKLSIVVSGKNTAVNKLKESLSEKANESTIKVTEKSRRSPVKLGFELILKSSETTRPSSKKPSVKRKKTYTLGETTVVSKTTKDGLKYDPILIKDVRKKK